LENEFLKKGAAEQSRAVSKKRVCGIQWGCEIMKLTRSIFYYQPKSKTAAQLEADTNLRDKIEAICLELPGYGYRRVTK
jgi:hypothetical protein